MSVFSGPYQVSDADAGQFTTGSTALHRLGTRVETRDGRVFRYVENAGVALVAGRLAVAATQIANHANLDIQTAAAIGDTTVSITLGSTLTNANDFAEGFLVVHLTPGNGISYLISGHPAADSGATQTLTLAEPIDVALTTSSNASLIKNPWKDVVISAADQADMAVGVAVKAIAIDAFGWVQTRGVCSVLADETIAVGDSVSIGDTTGGAVSTKNDAGEVQIWIAIQAAVDTEERAIFLTIE